ncbi:MAG: M55 family metallopeptidase [Spirochaetes bacterium]|nr:M55 family metallopeptidase [Spirochaetota bacterium]
MKKYMIRCDIEGVTGVVSLAQAVPGESEYAFGKQMFMSDLAALVEGLNRGGADEIWIYDEHCDGRNIDLSAMPKNVTAICGKPPYRADWSGGLDRTFDGLLLLGFHSKWGTPGGLLPHSYEPDICDIQLNGVSVGEIGMEAAIAGDHDVPLLLIVGDSAGVAEAERLIPGIAGVSVKTSITEHGGGCFSTAKTSAMIHGAAWGIVKKAPAVKPYRITGGVRCEISLLEGSYRTAFAKLHRPAMTDERTVVINGKTATDVWARYWQMKLAAQAEAAQAK